MTAQDIAYGDLVDGMPEIGQGALDTAIPPGRVFFCHANDELLNLFIDAWSAPLFSFLAAVKFVISQLLVPTHEGIGCKDGRSVFELLATQGMGQLGESSAFGVCQA